MKKTSLSFMLLVVIILIGVFFNSIMIVPTGQVGLRVHQGQAEVLQPGLHFYWPGSKPQLTAVNNQVSHFIVPLPNKVENLAVTVMWNVNNVPVFLKANKNQNEIMPVLQKQVQALVTPQLIDKTASSADLAGLVKQALVQDAAISGQGIAVVQVWVTGLVPTDAEQKKIFSSMNGLAATVGESIVQNGEAQAEAIRNKAEQDFIQSQAAALADAAKVLGEGNSDAVKVMTPLYQSNPGLFKAYLAAKMKLLTGTQSTS